MKDYYHIRKQTTPNEAADEYVLMLNQVQSLIRLGFIHANPEFQVWDLGYKRGILC